MSGVAAVVILLLLLSFAIIFSSGWRPALVSAPFWWAVAAAAYSVVPVLGGSVNGGSGPLLVHVSGSAVEEYLLYVGATSLLFACGWRGSFGSGGTGRDGIFSRKIDVSTSRLLVIVLFAALILAISAILSGIDPRNLLTTVSGAGYSYYEAGQYRWSFLKTLAVPFMIAGPPLLLYASRGSSRASEILAARTVYVACFALIVLAGVRANLILMLIVTGLLQVMHPRTAVDLLHRRVARWVIGGIVVALLYPVAMWMQESRALGPASDQNVSLSGFLDSVTPSAAIFDWVHTNGFLPAVSVIDAVKEAPPTILVPSVGAGGLGEVVDSLNVVGSGAAITTPAELYVNSGWVLGLCIAGIVGLLLGRWQRRLVEHPSAFSLMAVSLVGPAFAQIFTRGGLWQSLVLLSTSVWTAWVLSRVSTPRPAGAASRGSPGRYPSSDWPSASKAPATIRPTEQAGADAG